MVLMLCIFYRHRKNEDISCWGFFGNKGEIKKVGRNVEILAYI